MRFMRAQSCNFLSCCKAHGQKYYRLSESVITRSIVTKFNREHKHPDDNQHDQIGYFWQELAISGLGLGFFEIHRVFLALIEFFCNNWLLFC